MRKRVMCTVLACILALSLLPAAAAADVPFYTRGEAEAQFGIVIENTSLDFGTLPYNFTSDDVEAQYITITNNSSGTMTVDNVYVSPSSEERGLEFPYSPDRVLDPGESTRLKISIDPRGDTGSHSASLTVRMKPDAQFYSGAIGGGWGVGMIGDQIEVELATVTWSIEGFDQSAADNALSVDATLVDFGVQEADYGERTDTRTFTITNRGPYPMDRVEANMVYEEGILVGQQPYRVREDDSVLEPGESTTATVYLDSKEIEAGVFEGAWVQVTARYGDDYGGGEVTARVEVAGKFLHNRTSYEIIDDTNLTYGKITISDGTPFSKWGEPAYIPEGGSQTFLMTPYGSNHVVNVYLDGECLGPLDSYTLTNVHADHTLAAEFAPGPAPSQWAQADVSAAYDAGLVPYNFTEYGRDLNLPITRQEFCRLAYILYRTVTGESVAYEDYNSVRFTDCDDDDVQAMAYLGVVDGVGNGAFNPDGQLTREQAATILARLASAMGHPFPAGTVSFSDSASIAGWAAQAVGQVQAAGIMDGVGNNTFHPQGTYTREQSIVTLLRLYQQTYTPPAEDE